MKTTLNPFENAKRTAQGTGGIEPSVIEEIQAEITVLGSQNESQAQDITDIKAQLEELAVAYSTTEHKTGRKWKDGKDIYEVSFIPSITSLIANTTTTITTSVDYVENLISSKASIKSEDGAGVDCNVAWIDNDGNLKTKPLAGWTVITEIIVTIQYTKTTQE